MTRVKMASFRGFGGEIGIIKKKNVPTAGFYGRGTPRMVYVRRFIISYFCVLTF